MWLLFSHLFCRLLLIFFFFFRHLYFIYTQFRLDFGLPVHLGTLGSKFSPKCSVGRAIFNPFPFDIKHLQVVFEYLAPKFCVVCPFLALY